MEDPLWRHSPLVLARFPGVLVSVVAAAAVLGLAGAAGALFLSSASNAALDERLAASHATPSLTVVAYGDVGSEEGAPRDRELTAAVAAAGLGSGVRTALANPVRITAESAPGGSAASAQVQPMSRTGFLSHIRVIASATSSGTAGVWLSETTARRLGVVPGDVVTLSREGGRVEVPVAGVYRDLAKLPAGDYWAPLAGVLRAGEPDQPPPPPPLLGDPGTIDRVGARLGLAARFQWEFELTDRAPTLEEASQKANAARALVDEITDSATPLGRRFSGGSASTPLPTLVAEARAAAATLEGPVRTVSLAGQLLGLVGIAASALFAARRRRTELRLLAVRGEGPLAVGARSGLEALTPLALGGAVGWALGIVLVRALGPSPVIPPGSIGHSAVVTAWTLAIGAALVAMVAALTNRREGEEVTGRGVELAARFPWEAVALALAAAAYYELLARGIVVAPGETAGGAGRPASGHLDSLVLLFPILFIAGGSGLIVRGMQRWSWRLRVGPRTSPSVFLAARRLAASPRIALAMVTASALAVGVLLYSTALVDSARAAADDKALVAVGSATSVSSSDPIPLPPRPAVAMTEILAIRAGTSLAPSGTAADVLGIDPSTFAEGAFWESRFSGERLEDLLAGLSTHPPGVLPVVAVGGIRTGGATLVLSGQPLALRVVGTASTFPGMRGRRPMLVADRSTLERLAAASGAVIGGAAATYEVWSPAAPGRVEDALAPTANEGGIGTPRTASVEARTIGFLVLGWSFAFLEALGILAGSMALVGLLLYLQARQQAREVSYALVRRMGMRSRSHRTSILLELSGMLLAALAAGAAPAWLASFLVYRKLDLLPQQAPGPALRFPVTVLGLAAAALLLAAVIGSLMVQRRADRANVAEVMRVAG